MKSTRRSIGSMTLGGKLFLSFGKAIALTLLITLTGSVTNAVLSSTAERVAQATSIRQSVANEISCNFAELLSLERRMNLRALMKDSATAEAYDREFQADSANLAALLKQLAPMLSYGDDT